MPIILLSACVGGGGSSSTPSSNGGGTAQVTPTVVSVTLNNSATGVDIDPNKVKLTLS